MKIWEKIAGVKLWICGLLLPFLAGAGCAYLSPGYIEPKEFDLAVAATPLTGMRFQLGTFRNLSGSDRRFLYRGKDERMLADDYNRWLLTPDLMLERQFHKALFPRETRCSEQDRLLRLDGTIYRFEFDRTKRTAILSVDYTIRIFNNRRPAGVSSLSVTTEKPILGETSASAAAAMSGCVSESVARVRKFLIEINAGAQTAK